MMRSWGNRPDTLVVDEPFYAFYLKATGKKHPGADEVIATGETDWRKVVERLTGVIPDGKRIFYQKQMTHHLLSEVDRGWLGAIMNCFLVRDPREVIASYLKKQADPTLEDLGFVQQEEIFDWVRARAARTAARGRRRASPRARCDRRRACTLRAVRPGGARGGAVRVRARPRRHRLAAGGLGGRVLARDGSPIVGAFISVDDGPPATQTAADGTFRIDSVSVGDHIVHTRRSGYIEGRIIKCQSSYAKFTIAVANLMNGFMHTACTETES